MYKSGIYIGTGMMASIGCLFLGVTSYLNENLRGELKRIQEEENYKECLLKIHNNLAKRYDKFYRRVEARNRINSYRKILTSYTEGKILETGCGTGLNFSYYKENDDVTAVDYSDKMLEIGTKKLKDPNYKEDGLKTIDITCKNINLLNVDCEELEKTFGKNKFDTVVDFMNMQAYANPDKVLKNIKSVLKNKGKLLMICRGESDNSIISLFYRFYLPTTIMRYGADYTKNWDNLFLNDSELKCVYKQRKNYGKTYIYMFELNKQV